MSLSGGAPLVTVVFCFLFISQYSTGTAIVRDILQVSRVHRNGSDDSLVQIHVLNHSVKSMALGSMRQNRRKVSAGVHQQEVYWHHCLKACAIYHAGMSLHVFSFRGQIPL